MRRWRSLLSHVLRGKRLDAVAQTSALPLRSTNEPPTAALLERVSLPGPVPSRPAHLFRVWRSCQAWPAQVTRPKDHRRSWTRGTAHHRSCSSPRPKSHRCQSLKRVERRRSFARRERRGSKPLLRATNALLTGSTRIAESQRLCCFPHQCRLHPPFDSCHGLFVFELVIFLPNPRRSKAQHRLAVGSSRTVSHAAQRRDDIRQLVYFEEVGVNLRVGILMDED